MDDTLRLIFGHLTEGPHDTMTDLYIDGAATLSALARTCQTFSDLALDFLLCLELPTINHLFRCLPRDAYAIDPQAEPGDLLVSNHIHF